MEFNKKGQFLIIGIFFLLLLLLFISFVGTKSYYIFTFEDSYNIDSIVRETCLIGTLSNGTYLDLRFSDFESSVSSYCLLNGVNCLLNVSKSVSAPSNLSLLNYTHYSYELFYNSSFMEVNKTIICN